jgi:uncharacterized heparinase superfamily protein
MKLSRLLAMGVHEIAYRGWQETAKRIDRVAAVRGVGSRWPRARKRPDRPGGRFFAGAAGERTVSLIAAQTPWARDQALAAAAKLAQKRFDLLGYRELSFGDPIDWRLDAVSGVRAPLVHWSLIDALAAKTVGDSKVVWELNRQQWLVALGQAYCFTGDELHAEVFCARIREWMRANPPGIGINWASSLETALRLIAWCWALALFRGSRALTPALSAQMLEWIALHAAHTERYLSYYFSPNTHLTGEALGLFYAGTVFPELRDAGRWRALGARILVEQLDRQVLPDGVYFEQSTCYQRYTVEIYLHYLVLAARNGVPVPPAVAEGVQRMLDFLVAVRRPDGTMPQIGDADGGALLPLARRAPDDLRGVFATAAAFFARADYAWAAGGAAPELLWLLGPAGADAFAGLRPAPPAGAPSRVFPQGGYAVMRSGWDAHAHQMIFDAGPLGCPVSGAHGHADLLAVQCAVFGEPVLVDAGTHCYTADARWRDYFRSSAAHSTVVVDGSSQAAPAGPFKWRQRPQARLRRWISTESFDLADADHDGYLGLPDPVRHRRRIFFAKPRYWLIVDDLDAGAEHRVELRFQFAPIALAFDPARWARARTAGGRALLVRAFAAAPLAAEIRGGWISADYGQRTPAPVLVYSAATRLPLRIVTLLVPQDDPLAPPPAVAASMERIDLAFGDARETLHIGERDIVLCAASSAS